MEIHMAFNDLRRYLADLEAHGELRTIKTPVSTEIQLGAIARLACETYGPAALFENLVGYPTFRGLAAFETYSGNPDTEPGASPAPWGYPTTPLVIRSWTSWRGFAIPRASPQFC